MKIQPKNKMELIILVIVSAILFSIPLMLVSAGIFLASFLAISGGAIYSLNMMGAEKLEALSRILLIVGIFAISLIPSFKFLIGGYRIFSNKFLEVVEWKTPRRK